MVAHRGNPSTCETEAGGLRVQGQEGKSISVGKVPAMGTWVHVKLSVLAQTGSAGAGEVRLGLTGQRA